jgi:tyrosinase
MATPLDPFARDDGTTFTTNDCVNIETQLGYAYGPGSLDQYAERDALEAAVAPAEEGRTLHVGGVDRSKLEGSFLIAAFAEVDGERRLIGVEPVLSRWHVAGCANCQTHLKASADFRISRPTAEANGVEVEIHGRTGVIGGGEGAHSAGLIAEAPVELPFTVEIR